MKLGKIQKVDLREVWNHEASDFSKWLSSPDNIVYLNEIINLELVDIETEKALEVSSVIYIVKMKLLIKLLSLKINLKVLIMIT